MSYVARPSSGGFKIQKTTVKNGKTTRKAVPRTAWATIGFRPDMTLDEAKERVRQLNQMAAIDRKEAAAIENIAARVERDRLTDSVYFPLAVTTKFVEYFHNNYAVRQKDSSKVGIYWRNTVEICTHLKLLPKDFAANKNSIIGYIRSKKWSLSYTKKTIRIINMWGEFYSHENGLVYRPLPRLDTFDTQSINDAYLDDESYIGPSDMIMPSDLVTLKNYVTEAHFTWLQFSIWFGLRPSEVDRLASAKIEQLGKTKVLVIYQEKLVRVPRDQRFKRIPAFLPEQKVLLESWPPKVKRPLVKTLKRLLQKDVGVYGGRKGFVDLMLDKGQKLENISAWLGHSTVDLTWRVYRNKKRVSFDETGS
jgi:integrase